MTAISIYKDGNTVAIYLPDRCRQMRTKAASSRVPAPARMRVFLVLSVVCPWTAHYIIEITGACILKLLFFFGVLKLLTAGTNTTWLESRVVATNVLRNGDCDPAWLILACSRKGEATYYIMTGADVSKQRQFACPNARLCSRVDWLRGVWTEIRHTFLL